MFRSPQPLVGHGAPQTHLELTGPTLPHPLFDSQREICTQQLWEPRPCAGRAVQVMANIDTADAVVELACAWCDAVRSPCGDMLRVTKP